MAFLLPLTCLLIPTYSRGDHHPPKWTFGTPLGNRGTVTSTATPRGAKTRLASQGGRSQGKERDPPQRKYKRAIIDYEDLKLRRHSRGSRQTAPRDGLSHMACGGNGTTRESLAPCVLPWRSRRPGPSPSPSSLGFRDRNQGVRRVDTAVKNEGTSLAPRQTEQGHTLRGSQLWGCLPPGEPPGDRAPPPPTSRGISALAQRSRLACGRFRRPRSL